MNGPRIVHHEKILSMFTFKCVRHAVLLYFLQGHQNIRGRPQHSEGGPGVSVQGAIFDISRVKQF